MFSILFPNRDSPCQRNAACGIENTFKNDLCIGYIAGLSLASVE